MMITYEEFEKLMETFKNICSKEEALDDALHNMSPDFGGFYQEDVHDIILKMLEILVNDNDQWISYYIYELNWGNDWKKGTVTDKNGNDIPLKTYGDLYALLEEEFYGEADDGE